MATAIRMAQSPLSYRSPGPDSFPTYRPDCYGLMPSPAYYAMAVPTLPFDPATGIWYIYTMAGQVSRSSSGMHQ